MPNSATSFVIGPEATACKDGRVRLLKHGNVSVSETRVCKCVCIT